MTKLNCWEFMKCGMEPGGCNSEENGVCPVATEAFAHELNSGKNGGRLCWVIAENSNDEKIKCSASHKKTSCFSCDFRYKVTLNEGLLNICNATGAYFQLTEKSLSSSEDESTPATSPNDTTSINSTS